tara:strand:- start:49 stop:564 length:516 start_codon:yes stop_codon:yes gene_type:complete
MGIFSSDEQLFLSFEIRRINRKFLNIHKSLKTKNIEFDTIEESKSDTHSINYNYLIDNKDVCFTLRKVDLKNNQEVQERYFNTIGLSNEEVKLILSKVNKGGDSFVGLPKVDSEKCKMLEINSSIRNKEKEISIDTEYMMLLSLNNDWDKYSIRDFDIIADRIIKKTLKEI